jgi:hypothetical protein
VFPHLSSTDIPFSSYPLKELNMWSSWVKTKDTTQVYQVKGWFKKSYETFLNDFGKGYENGMMEGEKMDSRKKILKLKYFSPLKILTSPFYLQRLLDLFFFPSSFFCPFFNAPSL